MKLKKWSSKLKNGVTMKKWCTEIFLKKWYFPEINCVIMKINVIQKMVQRIQFYVYISFLSYHENSPGHVKMAYQNGHNYTIYCE